MKMKNVFLLIVLLCISTWNRAEAQCQAGFNFSQQTGSNIVAFANSSSGNYSMMSWYFGDGSTSQANNPVHTYNPGTYAVCLTVWDSNGTCQSTFCDTIIIQTSNNCDASFSTFDSLGIQFFIPNTYNANYDYFWSFGDGTSSTQPYSSHQYNSSGWYQVCLTVIDSSTGCSNFFCDSIYIGTLPPCVAGFNYQISNGQFYFYANNGPSGGITNYYWSFGDNTTGTGQFPIHTYANAGTYNVCLTIVAANGCSDTICNTVIVPAPPACNAVIAYQSSNNTGYFSGSTTGGTANSWAWYFSDGTTAQGQNVTHVFPTAGFYTACLYITTTAGCFDSTCTQVYISGPSGNCNATFQFFDSLGTYFFFPISNSPYNYYWTFGDGTMSTATYPTHMYSNPGTYTVCLTVSDSLNNCVDTWCDSIYIPMSSFCQAYYSYTVDTSNGAFIFNNLSQGNYTNVVWSFGDGSSATSVSPTHIYSNPGTYIVCLTIFSNNCQDSYCDSIVVGSGVNCVPQFYAVPDTIFGNGNVSFFIPNVCPGWQYVWSFGDSTNGSGGGPFIHQYAASGWYFVCVTAYGPNGIVITWCDSVNAFRLTSGLNESININSIQLYPNPSNGDVQIKFELFKTTSLTIEIFSIQGQLIQSRFQEHPSGVSQMRFDLSALESGMYMIRIRTAEQQINSRFLIQH